MIKVLSNYQQSDYIEVNSSSYREFGHLATPSGYNVHSKYLLHSLSLFGMNCFLLTSVPSGDFEKL